MADITAEDTSTDVIDPSTNEDADTGDVEDFGDVDWSEGEEVPDKTDETSTDEQAESDDEEAEPIEEDVEKSEDKEAAPEDEPVDKPEDTDEPKEKQTTPTDEQKRYNDEMARARIAERQARAEAEKAKKAAEEANIERYLQEAGDDEIEIQKRQLDVEQYRIKQERINLNAERLQSQVEKAAASIELFRTGSPAVQEELANSLDDFERMYVVKDEQGRPVEVRGNVYQYLQAKADSIQRLIGAGAEAQVKSKSNEKSRTMTTPVKAPKKDKIDPDVAGFDEEAARW